MGQRRNRNKIEILFIILNHLAGNSPERKTNLAHAARLNYRDLQMYLDILERQGMVELVIDGEDVVAITEKGRSIRSAMMMVLEEFGLYNSKESFSLLA